MFVFGFRKFVNSHIVTGTATFIFHNIFYFFVGCFAVLLLKCLCAERTGWPKRQSSLYENSCYEISLVWTFIMERISSAWLIVLTRTRPSEIPSEQKRTLENETGNKRRCTLLLSSPYALLWCAFCIRFLLLFKTILTIYVRTAIA
jgi:hypothetical protein